MPHFGIHLITLDKTIERLRSIDESYATFFEKERCLKMARWGAIGPDVFFWSFYERHGGIEAVENTLFLGYRIMEPFEKIKEILEPIEEDEEEIRNFITGGVYSQVIEQSEIIKGLLAALGVGTAATSFDFISWFELALAKGQNEPNWYWFDMLHYRNTGEFAKNLLFFAKEESNQETKKMLMAYALGYMTHLATDIVGHPYVNRFSGGPYRTQWHRHLLGENCMDTWAWDNYIPNIGEPQVNGVRNEIALAGIHEAFEFDDRIIKRLARLCRDALKRTYPGIQRPDILNQDQMLSLFKFMGEYLEKATTQSLLSIPAPQEPVMFPAIDDLFEAPSNIPNPADPDAGWEDVFRGIIAFISWSIETLIELLLLPATAGVDIITFPFRWWLYRINLLLYDLYRSVRLPLVLEGYILPFSDEIYDPALTVFRLQPSFYRDYPRRRNAPVLYNDAGEPIPVEAPNIPPPPEGHHLNSPTTDVEKPATISSPYNTDDHPSTFIESTGQELGQICKNLRRYIKCIGPFQPPDPELGKIYTDEVNKELFENKHPLGTAPDLGATFIAKALKDFDIFTSSNIDLSNLDDLTLDCIDFNLDGDRGFGWKCWRVDFDWNPSRINVQRYIKGGD